MWGSFIIGIQYNLTNIYNGWMGAKDNMTALKALFPYIQIYVLIYFTFYSQFIKEGVLLFFMGLGLFQTYIAGLLNISSTAGIPFPCHYIEPYLYLGVLYLDYNRILAPKILISCYSLIFLFIFIKYCLFLYSMVT